jgi:alkylhydroperoxidase family enzyme
MPRIRYIEEDEKTDEIREMIASAERTGAPDPRVVSIMTRHSTIGIAWVKFWNTLLYEGLLPHTLKELCRIFISMEHECGYCSTVRSTVAQAQGLTEEKVMALTDFETSDLFEERERAALRYARLFKQGGHAIDNDPVYDALKEQFSEEEIIELGQLCGQVDGVGKFVKSLDVISWGEACEINPDLLATKSGLAAE